MREALLQVNGGEQSPLDTFLTRNPSDVFYTAARLSDFPKLEQLSRKVSTNEVKRHFKGFQYADVSFFRETLNLAFGIGGWSFIISSHGLVGDPYTKIKKGKGRSADEETTEQEYQVQGYIVSPYLYSPVFGVGMALFSKDNHADPRSILSTVFAIAKSEALKNAGQQLGIAPNLKSGEQNDDNIAEDQEELKTLFDTIDNKDAALAAVTKVAPNAILNGAFTHTSVQEAEIDAVREALLDALAG